MNGVGKVGSDDGGRLLKVGYLVATFVMVSAFVVGVLYWWHFSTSKLSDSTEEWGQLGDYFGGLINPLVGLATVILVLINIRIQRLELKSSLIQLEISNAHTARQSFEQSLFAWLGNYHDLLSSIRLPNDLVGRSALKSLYRQKFSTKAVEKNSMGTDGNGHEIWESPQDTCTRIARLRAEVNRGTQPPTELHEIFWKAMIAFVAVYQKNRSELDALFRTLYRLILWIDRSHIDIEQRRHYVSLVRAQLSWIEMIFLLFNGLTEEGKKFGPLCDKYALFDNLAMGDDEVLRIICQDFLLFPPPEFDQNGPRPWPYSERAFSSDLARAASSDEDTWDRAMFSRAGGDLKR